ncbi:hypothetical protein CCP3SC15_1240004 [Gammaproteobacteria bacterium]
MGQVVQGIVGNPRKGKLEDVNEFNTRFGTARVVNFALVNDENKDEKWFDLFEAPADMLPQLLESRDKGIPVKLYVGIFGVNSANGAWAKYTVNRILGNGTTVKPSA